MFYDNNDSVCFEFILTPSPYHPTITKERGVTQKTHDFARLDCFLYYESVIMEIPTAYKSVCLMHERSYCK